MAINEQLEILKRGVGPWNAWREENPEITPNLNDANLKGKQLQRANLQGVSLQRANLQGAAFHLANLRGAFLHKADLRGAFFVGTNLNGASLDQTDIRGGHFNAAELCGANLQQADLRGVKFVATDLSATNVLGVKHDDNMFCKAVNLVGCHGSQQFVRHVMDLDYLEEFKEKHPWLYKEWKVTSDCGRSWELWALWSFGLAMFFAAILYLAYFLTFLPNYMVPQMSPDVSQFEAGWFAPIYFSIVTFTTLGFGDIVPANTAGQIFLTIEVVVGYIMLGGLISLISSKMCRRSG